MLNLSNSYFEFGPFKLDLRERLLLKDGEPVPLTPKTFDVLVILVQRSGSLVEKDELLNEVWPDTVVEENNLSQKIYQLRKILENGSNEDEYIQTVPRHGYRFVAEVNEVKSTGLEKAATAPAIAFTGVASAPARVRPSWRLLAGLGLLTLLTATSVWAWRMHNRVTPTNLHRVGVLPFKPLGADKDNEMLGLGLADALIGKLSTLSEANDLTVLPTNAVYAFSGRDYDAVNAARQLDLDALVTGTIQRDGDRVRITAQLISTADNKVIWSGQFDRTMADIFTLQDSISLQLAQSLKPALTSNQKQALAKHETRNVAAYEEYATAIYFWNKRSKEGLIKAIDHFQRAIDLDQSYARAHAGLADCYQMSKSYRYDIVSTTEAIEKQAEAARKAVELDDALAASHLEMAAMYGNKQASEDADREYQRALQLDPGSSIAQLRYANFLFAELKLDESARHMRLAVQLDPTSVVTNVSYSFTLLMERNYPEAIKYCERAIELDPQAPYAHLNLGGAYALSGKYDQAIQQYTRVAESDQRLAIADMARTHALAGRREEANQILKQLAKSSEQPIDYYNIALIQAALGENTEAISSLEKSKLSKWVLAMIKYDPALDSLRHEDVFAKFTQAHGLADTLTLP